jgi:hypothetical protein
MIGLFLIMNAGTIGAVFRLLGSLFRLGMFLRGRLVAALKMVFALMRANPIGLLITAVVGLGILVYKNFDAIVGYVKGAWDRIKAVFEVNFFDGLIQLWMEAWQGLLNGIVGIIKGIFDWLPDWMTPGGLKDFEFSFASDRAAKLTGGANSTSIVNAGEVKASGQIEVSFKDAPPGTRIEQTKAGGDVPVNTNVGYRSYALGAP